MNAVRDLCQLVILLSIGTIWYLSNQKIDAIAQDLKATQSILLTHVDKVDHHKPYDINQAIKEIFSQDD